MSIFGNDAVDDNLVGTTGDDTIYGGTTEDLAPTGGTGADTLDGGDGNDTLFGGDGLDTLLGGVGNDILDGGVGGDTMSGGAGDDTYIVDDATDSAGEDTDGTLGGVDIVESSVSFTLDFGIENLTLTGSAIDGTGNNLNNTLTGNSAANVLDGGFGTTSSVDTLIGLGGDDTYTVNHIGDVVTEATGGGNDTVNSSVTHTLGANVENLILEIGTTNISGTGNNLANSLTGNSGSNTLDGGLNTTGVDTLIGELGNDTYVVHHTGDGVTENASEGTDLVKSSAATYTLADNVENLTLTGTTLGTTADTDAINGAGNGLANTLTGNAGANTLDGGLNTVTTSFDTMAGGAGNDTYVVNNSGDIVTELATGGTTDLVQSSVNYTLTTNVENLTLTGTAIIGTGNSSNNTVTGNAEANTLSGAAGTDTLVGGAGDDTYILDNISDVVDETSNSGAGTDLVQSSVTHTLEAGVDNLTLTGTALVSGTGNGDANTLIGNSNANTLNGGAGVDAMTGNAGNDTYVVDNTSDTTIEATSGGTDAVQSSVTYTLATNVENLSLTGTGAINGTGNASNNVLTGNSGANTLDGGVGATTSAIDNLSGGAGNDTYVVHHNGDVVTEATSGTSGGTDLVQSSAATYTLGANVENLALMDTTNIIGKGNNLNNTLTGNSGNNTLDGGLGTTSSIDNMSGGAGDDIYIVHHINDVVTEVTGGGADSVQSSVTYTLSANVDNLTLTGTATINGTGNNLNNTLVGNAFNNVLDGGLGTTSSIDNMSGGAGNDTYIVHHSGDVITEVATGGTTDLVKSSAVSYTLASNLENLTLTGTASIDGTGNTSNNTLIGNSGDNVLDGGFGTTSSVDRLTGGAGDDTYVVYHSGDIVTESSATGGTDLVESFVNHTLAAFVDDLTLMGTANINGTGNSAQNDLTGNIGNNTLNGGTGADNLTGNAGNDIYVVDNAGDVVSESSSTGGTDLVQSSVTYLLTSNVENLTLTGVGVVNGTGNGLDNILAGNSVANTLNGGAGADAMTGGAGNDIYVVDDTGDTVTETSGGGTDIVNSSAASFTLSANVEKLTLTGTGNISGTGNDLANTLSDNTGTNTLTGGLGSDIYFVSNTGDSVVEASGEGTDIVNSSATSFTLDSNVENLTLTGSAAINGTGNELANTLRGNSAANILNSGAGIDTLIGGLGGDTYGVDVSGDVITEGFNAGTDTVNSSADTYTLSTNVENLTLITGGGDGTGNGLANILTGNSGANVLNGGAGSDSMIGAGGNDTYFVDSSNDVITEISGGGSDTVSSAINYSLAIASNANVEKLILTGSALNGTGNTLINTITGNAAANTLSGGVGADTLIGLGGNDTYIVDNTNDTVTEAASAGTDIVKSSATYTLSANVENLLLTGTTSIAGTGNASNNTLTGNSGSNNLAGGDGNDTLVGAAGSDTLDGGLGNDTLSGSAGVDSFKFTTATGSSNIDTITDFSTVEDTIKLDNAIFASLGAAGALSAAKFVKGAGAVALDANDFVVYNTTTGALSYDADGSGATDSVQIALIGVSSHAALTASDFTVI